MNIKLSLLKNSVVQSIIVFVAMLLFGFFLARFKPLWIDELYALKYSVIEPSYQDIIFLQSETFIKEGNLSPLFYLTHKAFCDLFGVVLPAELLAQEERLGVLPTFFEDPYLQVMARIQPVFFMALSIAVIFYFFVRSQSLFAGIYAILVSLSSYMMIIYFPEAKHYPIWVFLTTMQMVVFLLMMRSPQENQVRLWKILTIAHFALSFTVVFSLLQILMVSLLLLIFKSRDLKNYIFLSLVPMMISVFYAVKLPRFDYWFWHGPKELVAANFPSDRWLIVIIFLAVFFGVSFYKRHQHRSLESVSCIWKETWPTLLFTLGFVGLAVVMLIRFKIYAIPKPQGPVPFPTFPVPARFFIFLTPVAIITTTSVSVALLRLTRNSRAAHMAMIILLAVMLLFRASRSIHNAKPYFPKLFSYPSAQNDPVN